MSKLQRYATKSTIMDVYVELGDETFKFNLNEELMISEEKINNETLVQSSSYAFLSMLYQKLIKASKDAEMEAKKTRAQKFLNWKQDINPETQRPYNDETASCYAEVDKKYQEVLKKWLETQEKCNFLGACVKAFEMRKDLIQTLSANIRKG